jgi:putative ABC transport system substrate-binding protein
MRRREFIAGLGGAAAWPLVTRMAFSQPARAPRTIGFLYPGPLAGAPPRIAALLSGLRAGGFREPEDVKIVARITEGDPTKLAPMAADLVAQNVDLLVPVSPAAVRALRLLTKAIPILAGDLESDPVSAGFIASVARPGGNLTGVFLDFPDFTKKWLEFLKEAVPDVASVAVFWDPTTGQVQYNAVEAAAKAMGLKLVTCELRGRAELDDAFARAHDRGANALLMLSSPFVGGNTKLLAERTLVEHVPAVTLFTDFARDGGLMAYGPNLLAFFRQEGVLASKILKGEKPADLPIETPTKFEFVVNLKTARLLNVTIPPSILLRADEVVE